MLRTIEFPFRKKVHVGCGLADATDMIGAGNRSVSKVPKSKNRRKPKGSASSPASKAQSVVEGVARAKGEDHASSTASASSRAAPQQKTSPVAFFRQVRDEARKITWTTRSETTVSTGMVLVMVVIASIFFFTADSLIRTVMGFIL